MNKFFTIGAVAAWLLPSIVSGKLWPVLSLPTILVVTIGGVVGVLFGPALSRARRWLVNPGLTTGCSGRVPHAAEPWR